MEGMTEFIGILNKALPGAWEATVRQAYIHGSLLMFFAVALGIVAGWALMKLRASGEELEDTDGFFIIVMFLCALFSLTCLIFGGIYLINPEYHAIQLLKP